ncbi:hypothetical protein ACH5RR_006129 [Cinchona calisaya]|uniref:Uncharacterized protein n=1 Tax=Cinchona calisaya TaxID=153742 RepID=A0ABD3ANH1_9GENT
MDTDSPSLLQPGHIAAAGKVEEENPQSSTTALLIFSTNSSPLTTPKSTAKTILFFICLILTNCIAFSAALASPSPSTFEVSHSLNKLNHPVVLLISSDGFRFGYQFKTKTPNLDRLINNGTEAEKGLIPVFPAVTFPNHYSIVTGLYPAYHGIIHNYFTDPKTGEVFSMNSHEPSRGLGSLYGRLWQIMD